jgi:transposase
MMDEVAVVGERPEGKLTDREQLRFATVAGTRSAAADDREVNRAPRLRMANRHQLRLEAVDPDSRLAQDHPARAIWRVLERLDLRRFYQPIKAVEGQPGQDTTDPRILIALWLLALSEGVSSARAIARLCEAHDGYRWICGGVSVNHHMLSDFRKAHDDALDNLFSQVLAVLMHKNLVSLHRVAQDGMRVRASAGAASFHRQPTLQQCLDKAKARVAELKAQGEQSDDQRGACAKAAQERVAREREARVEEAVKELEQIQSAKASAKNHPQRKTETRVSTTDPEARRMKMANGGYHPAYNLQFATDVESRIIVAVRASNDGNDNHQLKPTLDEIKQRTHRLPSQILPSQILLDGGYMNFAAIEAAAARGVEVFAPPRENKDYHINPWLPQPGDSPAIFAYRQRMATGEGKEIYKQRAATAETVNADLRTWRGLGRLLLRGTAKVLIAATWSALTYNILRAISMGWL